MKLPKISIVVASYTIGRFQDLVELLDSIQAQTYQNVETLLVIERSLELYHAIEKYIAERSYPHVQMLYNQGEWGISSARNLAIGQVTGDIIAFTDDDALLFPDWAGETAKTYAQDSSTIGVAGPILPLWEQESMNWCPREYYWIFSCTYWDMAGKEEVRNGYGTNLSFRREAFDVAGLFKTSLGVRAGGRIGWQRPGGEETEFSLRVRRKTGKRSIYYPQVRVRHKVYRYRLTTGFVTRRAYWEGYAKAMLNQWYRSSESETAILATEYELLRRILSRLLPQTLGRLFRQPLIALRQLWVTVMVLSCVAGGYLGYKLSRLLGHGQPYGAE